MDWTKTNDFESEEHFSDYSSLETEGNIDYGSEQRESRPQQDPNHPNNALGDNRADSSKSKQLQSYANQMENASKALAIAFQDAQRLPQNNSFALNNSERHVNPRNHNLLGLGFHDSSQAAINPSTSINKLLSDTDRLLNGVQQSTNQQHQPSRDQNYGPNDRQQCVENLIGAAASGDAQNSVDPLGLHLVRPDGQSSDGNFAQLRDNSHRLQSYSDANNVLDNLLGAAVNAQNLVGVPSANLVRNENSVTDGSHTSSFDFSRSGSSSHPSIDDARSQSHMVNQQRGGFDAASLSTFGASGELRSNFRQAQNQSNLYFSGLSRNRGVKDGLAPLVFNADTKSQKHNHQPTHNPRQSSRNEREQQRAAKISEVIDKLRNTMVQGGWKVEMKSKYQVLST
jgi:hypothetical protein